jgi:hypothetical protein
MSVAGQIDLLQVSFIVGDSREDGFLNSIHSFNQIKLTKQDSAAKNDCLERYRRRSKSKLI